MNQNKQQASIASGQRNSLSMLNKEKNHLRLYNSLTKKNDLFLTKREQIIRWYTCGPTVYDVAHLGHARCYITFDIIRRILTDYFGYEVNYVMNITDIDDKIIKRARSSFLYDSYIEQYLNGHKPYETFLSEIEFALQRYERKAKKLTDLIVTDEDKAKLVFMQNTLESSKKALIELGCLAENRKEAKPLLEALRDVVAEDYDEQHGSSFDATSMMSLFKDWAMKYENEFNEDMKNLNVLAPSSTPRVSEFIEQVGTFIQKLKSLGYAYEVNGSVYFNTQRFDADPKHSYAKLVREAYEHKAQLDSGEGELSVFGEKKSTNDFALWKKSKPGEPAWKVADLEPGRPGWHIECSVMATQMLGETLDIHSGGCDLKFPHHDNEIAQSEAFYNTGRNWVNFFLHSGHLSIAGCKMSKSLKNFITIRQALQKYTARQLRFAFLCHKWTGGLDYSENTLHEAIMQERLFKEFLLNVAYILWDKSVCDGSGNVNLSQEENHPKRTASDSHLYEKYIEAVNLVDQAICDNFDSSTVLKVLHNLIKEFYKCSHMQNELLKEISKYIENILSVFGVTFENEKLGNQQTTFGYIKELAKFRAEVRGAAKDEELLKLCDNMRDRLLMNLGVQIEDKDGSEPTYRIRFVDPEVAAEEKVRAVNEKHLKDEKARADKLKLQQQREDKMKINPREMFLGLSDKYSKFDEAGMPTHDIDGKEISKSALKKLQRIYKEQKDKYERFMAGQG